MDNKKLDAHKRQWYAYYSEKAKLASSQIIVINKKERNVKKKPIKILFTEFKFM